MRKPWGWGCKLPAKGEGAREAETERDRERKRGSLQGSGCLQIEVRIPSALAFPV